MHVGGIFCDLAKASDYGNHETQLTKFNFLAYKETRKQKIEKKSSNSIWGTIKQGVLQG
jgi:hypothetical protein